jgi:hypothetical protein
MKEHGYSGKVFVRCQTCGQIIRRPAKKCEECKLISRRQRWIRSYSKNRYKSRKVRARD